MKSSTTSNVRFIITVCLGLSLPMLSKMMLVNVMTPHYDTRSLLWSIEAQADVVVPLAQLRKRVQQQLPDANAMLSIQKEEAALVLHDVTSSNDNTNININNSCPYQSIVANKVGLFNSNYTRKDHAATNPFENVLLVVACNYAYYNMLQNWEYLANELNLQWIVLALDDELYNLLGPDRAIRSDPDYTVRGAHGWGRGNFTKIVCNKLRMAVDVATHCHVDIVFSDVDNIFLHNPFDHDFGRLIQSGRYDYLYQTNDVSPSGPGQDQCMRGQPRPEANTGFYYFRHQSTIYQSIIAATLKTCAAATHIQADDQTLFWKELWNVEQHGMTTTTTVTTTNTDNTNTNPNNLATATAVANATMTTTTTTTTTTKPKFRHCGLEYDLQDTANANANAVTTVEEEEVFTFCCLDPYYYPVGRHKPRDHLPNRDPITYHANYADSYDKKIQKLVTVTDGR